MKYDNLYFNYDYIAVLSSDSIVYGSYQDLKVIEIKLEVLEWYHFCLMKTTSTYLFFIDGNLTDEYEFNVEESIPLNGTMVLGQDVSNIKDITMAPHFLAGQIANFELWLWLGDYSYSVIKIQIRLNLLGNVSSGLFDL